MAQYNSYSSNPIALAVTMGLASILAVLLRILARRSSKFPLGLDDIFAVVALCGLLTFLGSIIYGWLTSRSPVLQLIALLESYNGLGYDNRVLPPKVLGDRLKVRESFGAIGKFRGLTSSGSIYRLGFGASAKCCGKIQSTLPLQSHIQV